MRNLYIDFDGVLVDTITTTYQLLDESQINKKDAQEVRKFYQTLNWEEVIGKTPLINDSMKGLERIIESQRFNISILTHVVSISEAVEKIKFIRKYFHGITIIPCPKDIRKDEIVHAKDAILIDDYAGNLRLWEQAGGIGVRFSTKLNDKGFLCIDKIDQILEIEF